jgi:uncharacterized protein (TIGR02246 family)
MSTRRKRLGLALLLCGGLLAALGTVSQVLTRPAGAGEAPKQKNAGTPSAGEGTRKADRAQLQAQMERFLKAFESGDAGQVASFWTPNGELIGDDGTALRGRAAIEKSYREAFGKKETRKAEIQRDSLRFPSQDTAVEEGYFKVRLGKGAPISNRYSILHVREGGQWLMALVREWPAESVSLRDLDWLIGTWAAKRDDTEVHTTYEWLWDKSFIRVQFTVRQKDRTVRGFQMIGRDPASRELRSWTFESAGGFGEATWSRDGNKWVLDSAGRLSDGSTMAATIILNPLGPDVFSWQAVRRSTDGEAEDDLPPIKVTRVKSKR